LVRLGVRELVAQSRFDGVDQGPQRVARRSLKKNEVDSWGQKVWTAKHANYAKGGEFVISRHNRSVIL
jgi:hypothetical protein